jgi:hypothetical protein
VIEPPAPGHRFWQKMDLKLDNGYQLALDLTLPSAMPEFNLSTLRLGRHGGEVNDDRIFRARLYERIGAVTVAGGHAETAMKRLLLLLKGEAHFSQMDENWSTLHKKLLAWCIASPDDPRVKRLTRLLEWGETNRVKSRRDDAIHAYWWQFDGCGVVRSRFRRKEDGASIIGSMAGLEEDAELLFQYARRLDDLLGEDWPHAMLPRLS